MERYSSRFSERQEIWEKREKKEMTIKMTREMMNKKRLKMKPSRIDFLTTINTYVPIKEIFFIPTLFSLLLTSFRLPAIIIIPLYSCSSHMNEE